MIKNENIDFPKSETAVAFNVPATQRFYDVVVSGFLEQTKGDILSRTDYTLVVPDREAYKALRSAFRAALADEASFMPHITSLANVHPEDILLKARGGAVTPVETALFMETADRFDRQLFLAAEIQKLPGMASAPQKALKLAAEMGHFLDTLHQNNINPTQLHSLAPKGYEAHWQRTSAFLSIISDVWPARLTELGQVDEDVKKNYLAQRMTETLQGTRASKPIWAVGFTEVNDIEAQFLAKVASLPRGRIILHGVDVGLDEQSERVLTEVHPQYVFRKILSAIGLSFTDVREWQTNATQDKTQTARQKLIREAFRPAGTAEGWSRLSVIRRRKETPAPEDIIDARGLDGISLAVAGTSQEEASVVALKLRETLETPGKTAVLVTSSRSLARRVTSRLQHWDVHLEPAAQHLSETPLGTYLSTTAHMAAEKLAPVPLLAALKHPYAALGLEKQVFVQTLAVLEDTVLRGARPSGGVAGLRGSLSAAFNRARRNARFIGKTQKESQRQELEVLLSRLDMAGKDFFALMESIVPQDFTAFLKAHLAFAEALAVTPQQTGVEKIGQDAHYRALERLIRKLEKAEARLAPMIGADYAEVLDGFLKTAEVNDVRSVHPRLRIATPEEAQNLKADVVIIGGLNDETFPPKTEGNPWLSPSMQRALGLPSPEAVIGRAARQFSILLANPEVLLTRAEREDATPAVASPFLTRLSMVLRGAGFKKGLGKPSTLLALNETLKTPREILPMTPPAPTPSLEVRPKRLPVTAIETLMRDPYAIYARYILDLKPKEALDAAPGAAEKGIFTHAALDEFVRRYPDQLPENAKDKLLEIGEETFRSMVNNPAIHAFWWPRFERVADWFVRFESERREVSRTLGTEVKGRLELDMDGATFVLTAIADRIDMTAEDTLAMVDYKTGSVPAQKAVSGGLSPQLTLEAAIAFKGGFDGIDAVDVGQLQYWKLSGGRPAGEVIAVKGDTAVLMQEALTGVENLIRAFNDAKTPYHAVPRPSVEPRYNRYEHLARRGEWDIESKKASAKTKPKRAHRKSGAKRSG